MTVFIFFIAAVSISTKFQSCKFSNSELVALDQLVREGLVKERDSIPKTNINFLAKFRKAF